jgi:hypothetical protein
VVLRHAQEIGHDIFNEVQGVYAVSGQVNDKQRHNEQRVAKGATNTLSLGDEDSSGSDSAFTIRQVSSYSTDVSDNQCAQEIAPVCQGGGWQVVVSDKATRKCGSNMRCNPCAVHAEGTYSA